MSFGQRLRQSLYSASILLCSQQLETDLEATLGSLTMPSPEGSPVLPSLLRLLKATSSMTVSGFFIALNVDLYLGRGENRGYDYE